MKIRTQIVTTLALVAVLPVVVLVWLGYRQSARDIAQALDQSLRSSAERTAARVDAFLLSRLEEVRSLATLPGMKAALAIDSRRADSIASVGEILTLLQARDPVNSIAFGLVDHGGSVVADAEPRWIGVSEHEHDYFRAIARTRMPWANQESWPAASGNVLVIASPVRNDRGVPIGTLRLVLENATLQQMLSASTSADGVNDLALFDPQGRLIADAWWPTKRHQSLKAPRRAAAANTDLDAHFVDWIGPDGNSTAPGRVAYAPLSSSGWRMMAWQPRESYDAAVVQLGHQRLNVLALLMALLAVAAWLASRWIARPIQHLERAAKRIAQGDLGATIPAGTGEVGSLGVTLQAMTERMLTSMHDAQQSAHDARCASEAKSQFLANMSHELRTPLAAILGFAELVTCDATAGQEAREHAQTIHRNAQHLLGLVNEVLDLAKVESGTMEIVHEAFAPIELARGIVDLMNVQARDKGIAMRCKFGNVPLVLRSDPHRLKQILINLVGNAVKFTDSGAIEVSMGVAGDPAILVCEVTDTGPGIDPDSLLAMFEPFAQVDSTMTRRHGGTGLGLAISRQLARKLGGDLIAHSEVGKGSTFVLTVPADEPPPAPLAAPTDLESNVPLHGRILVVDDGADNRRLLAHILRKAGAQVEVAADGMEGLCACSQGGDPTQGLATPLPFDMVLMDMQMPVLDGLTATRQLRAMGLHIPIIALTAHAMDEARDECLASGFDEWASKPIAAGKLRQLCATWLEHSRRACTAHATLHGFEG